jgi:outer membrane immunogenic protein
MRALYLSALVAVGLSAAVPAMAADMPLKAPPPVVVYDWTGTYIGINGGGGWASSHEFNTAGVDSGFFRQSGALIGGTYGGNWQSGKIVAGFEGDYDWSRINGSINNPVCAANGTTTCFTNLRSFGTERVRFGYDFGGWMLYGTGGVIWGNIRTGVDTCGGAVQPACGSQNEPGWTAGVGLEWMFARNWSIKAEWLHYQFVTDTYFTPTGGTPISATERGDLVRGGLNWHFDAFSWIK